MTTGLLAGLLLASASSSHAATITWSGVGTDWGTGASNPDWGGSVTPGATDVAEFNLVSANQPNIGTSTAASVGSLWAATGLGQTEIIGVTGAGTLTIAGNVTTNGAANTGILVDNTGNYGLTVNAPVTISNNTSFTVNNASQLAIHGALNLNGKTLTLTGNNAGGSTLIDGGISGAASTVTVNTSGSVILGGTGSYTGLTTLSGGILQLSSTGAIAASSGLTASANGVTLQLRSDSNAVFGWGGTTTVSGTTTIDVNQITAGNTNKTLSIGTVSLGAFPLTVTGGNGYSLSTGTVTATAVGAILAPYTAALNVAGATITGNGITLGGTGTGTIGTIIGTTGGVTKNTPSTWTLTGTSTYNTTTLSAGKMILSGTLINCGLITISGNGSLSQTVANALAGTTSLTVSGGIATLSASNSFTGATQNTGGVLVLTQTNALVNSALTMNSTNGTILELRNDTAATFNLPSVTFTTVATIDVNRSNTSATNNTLTLNPSTTSGTVTLGATTLNVTGGNGYSLAIKAISLTGNATLNPTTASIAVGSGTIGTNTLTLGGVSTGNTIGSILGTTGAVTLSGSGTWTLTGTNTYTGATLIGNNGNGANTVIITGSMGNTAITNNSTQGAVLSLQRAGAVTSNSITLSGATGQGVLNENVDNAISGNAALTINGACGWAILTNANNYTGATTVSNGVLRLSNTNAIASSVMTMSGGTLQLRNDSSVQFNMGAGSTIGTNAPTIDVNQATGAGANQTLSLSAINGSAQINVTGGNGYSLGIGTLTLTAGLTLNPLTAGLNVTNVAAATFALTLNGTTSGTLGAIAGTTATVAQNATNNLWVLTGTNTYTGNTTVSTGTMQITGRMGATNVTVNTTGRLILSNSGALNSNTLTVTTGTVTETVDNGLAGTAALTSNGGMVYLDHANNNTGNTTVNSNGTIWVSNTGALSSSTLSLNGANVATPATLQLRSDSGSTFVMSGTTTFTGASNIVDVNQLTGAGSNNQIAMSGPLGITGGTLAITGGNGYSLSLGALTMTGAGGIAAVTANVVVTSATLGNNTLTLTGSASSTLNGLATGTITGTIAGTGQIVKSGNNLWTLTGGNTYTGATTVNAGILQISGASGTMASTSFVLTGGTMVIDNTTAAGGYVNNRLAGTSGTGTASFTLSGGSFLYIGSDSANSTERLGNISIFNGYSTATISYGNAANTAVVTGSSITRPAGSNNGTALINGVNLGLDSTSTAGVARIQFVTAPTQIGATAALSTGLNSGVTNTQVVPFLVGESAAGAGTATGTANTFLTYNAATGLRPLDPTTEFVHASITPGANTYVDGATAANSTASINSLVINGGDLTIGSASNLTNTSGALLFVTSNSINQDLGTSGTYSMAAESLVTVNPGVTATISAPIVGAFGFTKSGPGTLVLSGSNAYTGMTVISAGTLKLGATNSIPTSGSLTLATNSVFDLNGNNQTLAYATNSGLITSSGAASTLTIGNNSSFGSLAGNLSLIWNQGASSTTVTPAAVTNTGDITFNANGAGNMTATAIFNNTGRLINSGTGTGTVTLTGNAGATNLTGIVQSATTSILKLGGTFAPTANLTVNSGTVQASATLTTGTTGFLTVNNSGVFDLNGQTVTSGLLSGASTTGTVTNTNATAKNLTLSGTTSATFAGVIAGKTNLVLTTGTQILSGANTSTGTVTVNGGLLQINGGAAMNTFTSLTLANGMTVALRGDSDATYINGNTTFTTAATIDVNNLTPGVTNHTLSLGSLSAAMATLNITGGNGYTLGLGTVTMGANGLTIIPTTANVNIGTLSYSTNSVTLGGTAANNYIGTINFSSVATITKSNASTWTLTGAASGTTSFNISGGSLIVANGSGSISGYPTLNVSGGVLNLQNAYSVASANMNVTGTAAVTENTDYAISGSSVLTINSIYAAANLNNLNDYTGATTLTAGMLTLGNANSIGNSSALTLTTGFLRLRNDASTAFVTGTTTTIGGNLVIDLNQSTPGNTGNTLSLSPVNNAISIAAATITVNGGNGYSLSLPAVTQTGAVTYIANTNLSIPSITGATLGVTVNGGGNTTIGNLNITTGALTKNGAGTLTLNGAGSTITGAITINGGILNANTAAINGSNVTSGITITTNGILQAASGGIVTNKAITLTGFGIFDINGQTNTLGGVISAGTFIVANSGATPGSLTLSSGVTNLFTNLILLGGTTNASSTSANIANSTITLNGGTLQAANALTLAKVITLGGAGGTIDTQANNSSVTLAMVGPGTLTKSGSGQLTLTGASITFSGGIVINSGTVQANVATSALGTGNITFGASNTPTLDLNNQSETVGLLSGGTNSVVTNSSATSGTVTLTLTSSGQFANTSGTQTFGGQFTNPNGSKIALTKSGPGTQVLNGSVSNSNVGTTIITGGVLKLDFSNMATPTNLLGATTSSTNVVMMGGALSLLGKSGAVTTSQTLTSLNTTAGAGRVVINPNGGTSTTLTISGSNTIARSAGTTLNFDISAGTSSTALVAYTGTYSGVGKVSGGITMTDNTGTYFAYANGANIVPLTGSNTLAAASTGAAINFTTAPDTDGAYTSGTLTMTNAAHALNTLTIVSGSGGTLDLGGNATTLAGFGLLMSGTGNYAITDGTIGSAATELVVNQFSSGTLTLGASFSTGAVTMTKAGPGTLAVTAVNNYTGGTNLNGGITQISAANNFGATNGVNFNGGTLEVTTAGFDFGRTIAVKGAGGTLQVDAGTLTMNASNITLADKSYLTIQGAGNFKVSGNIVDSGVGGGVIIASTGTTTFGGGVGAGNPTNNFSGGLILNAGTLVVSSTGSQAINLLGQSTAANAVQLNGGTMVLSSTGSLSFIRNVTVGGNMQITADAIASGTGNIYSFGTLAIGNTLTVAGGPSVTSGTTGVTFGATTLTGNTTLNIQDPVSGGVTQLTLGLISNGTNTLTLTGNGNFINISGMGPGSGGLTLDSNYTGMAVLAPYNNTFAHDYTGATTIKSGTLAIGTGTTAAGGILSGIGYSTVYLGDTTGSAHNASLLFANNIAANAYGTVANNIVVQAGNAGQAIIGGTNPLNINVGQTPYTTLFTGQVTLNKDVVLSPGQTQYANSTTTVAGMMFTNLTGAGGINISGTGLPASSSGQGYGIATGAVTLVGENTYQGDTKVLAGVLQLASGTSGNITKWVGTSTNALVLGDTAGVQSSRLHLSITGTSFFNRDITTQAGSGGIAAISSNSGANYLTGNLTLNKGIYFNGGAGNGGSLTLTGNIADGANAIGGMTVSTSVVQANSAALSNVTLAGANTYDGGTLVGAGFLTGTSAGAFGTGNVVVETGVLRLGGTTNLAANKDVYVGPLGALSIISNTITPSYLQSVLDKNSSGAVLLATSNNNYANNLDMSQLGNGLMYLSADGYFASTTYSAASLGANSDGNYRLGWGGLNGFLAITNGVLVDGTNGGNTHAQLIVGGTGGNYGFNRVGTYTMGSVSLNGTNTFSGGIVVNSQSRLTGLQGTVAGASPFGSSSNTLTLHNSSLILTNNNTSSVATTLGDTSFDGNAMLAVTGIQGGTNSLTVGNITRSGSGTLMIGNYIQPQNFLGTNTIVKTSGAAPATVATVDTNGSGTGLSNMIAPYYMDAFGNYLSYNATTGFTPITTSIITTDGLTGTNAFVKTVSTGATTIATSATIAALNLGGNLLSSANTDITIKITTGGLNNFNYANNVANNNGLNIGAAGSTGGHINLDFNGQEAVIMNTSNQNGGLIINNNITNTGGNGLTKSGYGILYLASATNDFTGTITINGVGDSSNGSGIKITTDSALGNVNNGLVFNGGSLMASGQFGTVTLNPNRKVTLANAGAYFWFENNSAYSTSAENLTIQGVVTGTGAIIGFATSAPTQATVSSTVMLTNSANDFVAPIWVGLGASGRVLLAYSDDHQLGNAANTVTLVGGNSCLQYTGTSGSSMSRGIVFSDQGGSIDVVNNVTLTANGPITGSGVFSKDGNGTLALTASNGFVGNVIVNGGVLSASHDYALGVSDAVVTGSSGISGGKVSVQSTGELDLSGNITLGGAGGKTLYLNGAGIAGAGALHNLSGTNSNVGQVVMQTNTTIATDAGSQLNLSGTVSGAAELTKTGAGTLALNAINSYTGNTNINAGTVIVHGAITGGTVAVNNTGTLAGDGSVGPTNLLTGGNLQPGTTSGTGTLTTGNLKVVNGSKVALAITKADTTTGGKIAGTDFAKLVVSGTLDISSISLVTAGGGINISLQNVTGDGGTFDPTTDHLWTNVVASTALNGLSSFTLAGSNYDQSQGQFHINSDSLTGALGLGDHFFLVQNQTNINALDLQYLATVPEPQTWAMLISGAGLLGLAQRLRRRK